MLNVLCSAEPSTTNEFFSSFPASIYPITVTRIAGKVVDQPINSTNFVAPSSNGTKLSAEVRNDASTVLDNSGAIVNDVIGNDIDVYAISRIKKLTVEIRFNSTLLKASN